MEEIKIKIEEIEAEMQALENRVDDIVIMGEVPAKKNDLNKYAF